MNGHRRQCRGREPSIRPRRIAGRSAGAEAQTRRRHPRSATPGRRANAEPLRRSGAGRGIRLPPPEGPSNSTAVSPMAPLSLRSPAAWRVRRRQRDDETRQAMAPPASRRFSAAECRHGHRRSASRSTGRGRNGCRIVRPSGAQNRNRSKMARSLSCGMPGPWSSTVTITRRPRGGRIR